MNSVYIATPVDGSKDTIPFYGGLFKINSSLNTYGVSFGLSFNVHYILTLSLDLSTMSVI